MMERVALSAGRRGSKCVEYSEDRHYLEERNYVSLVKPYKAFFSTGRNNKEN